MPIRPPNWAGSAERSVTAARTSDDVARARMKELLDGKIGAESVDVLKILEFFEIISANPTAFLDASTAGGGVLVDRLIELVSGFTIRAGTVETALKGKGGDGVRLPLGLIFTTLIQETLPTEDAATGWLARNPGGAEQVNMARMVGAAFRMQIGDMLADWAGKAIPFGLGNAFTQVAERIDKAINLDDAIEEIIQVPMEAVITRGLQAYYNRLLKPADLSANEALRAEIADKLKPGELTKILDNAGYRDDIRQILRENAAGNLTESDLDKGYQWNLLSREQVKKQYRDRAFEEPDAELKTKLVEMERRQKLREKVFELYGNLYRDGVATKQEVTPFLENYGYDADEVEMWFQVQELERRQRKWMSDATLLKLLKGGIYTFQGAIDYLVLQGMTTADAAAYVTLASQAMQEEEVKDLEREAKEAIKKLPKEKRDKCEDLLKPEDIFAELLSRLIGLIPGDLGVIPGAAKLKNYIECILKELATP